MISRTLSPALLGALMISAGMVIAQHAFADAGAGGGGASAGGASAGGGGASAGGASAGAGGSGAGDASAGAGGASAGGDGGASAGGGGADAGGGSGAGGASAGDGSASAGGTHGASAGDGMASAGDISAGGVGGGGGAGGPGGPDGTGDGASSDPNDSIGADRGTGFSNDPSFGGDGDDNTAGYVIPVPASFLTDTALRGYDIFINREVRSRDGQEIGTVEGFQTDPATDEITHVLLKQKTLFGLATQEVTIPWDAVRVGPSGLVADLH